MRGLTGSRSAGLQAVRHAWHAQAQTTCSGMLCCAHMPMRMHIHVCMLSSLRFMPYEPSVLRLVAVMATRQQDAGSWKTLHVLLLRAVYRLSEAARMLSRESRMLHEKYAMQFMCVGMGMSPSDFRLSPCVERHNWTPRGARRAHCAKILTKIRAHSGTRP